MNRQNQTATSYGEVVSVKDIMESTCQNPFLSITATKKRELSELLAFWFDVYETTFIGKGKIENNQYGPEYNRPVKDVKQKNMFQIFNGNKLDIDKNGSVTITEFANDGSSILATADIENDTTGPFSDVSSLQADDTILIVKWSEDSGTIQAKVKIVSVDKTSNELTFDTNVTINKDDYITFISAKSYGCQNNTKEYGVMSEQAKKYTYNTQFFTARTKVDTKDFTKTYSKKTPAYKDFLFKLTGVQFNWMFNSLGKQFRHGAGTNGASPEIKGYDTIIEERDADGITSKYDFADLDTAQDIESELESILYDINQAPVDSKFIAIVNNKFHRSHKNVMQKLRRDREQSLTGCCELATTIHDGLMKYNVEESPMIDFYISDTLSQENPFSGVAYILPKDLCAAFVPETISVEIDNGNKVKEIPNKFGQIFTREILSERTAKCRSYEFYMEAGIAWAWVSYRDTYKKIENFNFTK